MSADNTVTTASGLQFTLKEKGNGDQAQAGMNVSVHYSGKLEDGTEFDNSFKRGEPIKFPLGQGRVIPGWEEGIAMMQVGDKADLVIPPDLAYGANGAGGVIPPHATLKFEVELVSVEKMEMPVEFDVAGKEEQSTASGLKYVVVEENKEGAQAHAGNQVAVHYTGYLEDGTIFDSSIPRGEPLVFGLGQGQVITGWDEGIRLMKVGDKLRLTIPSDLAYGANGAGGVIPPNATLIFDVELVDAK